MAATVGHVVGKTIVPGVQYRPASDNAPTAIGKVAGNGATVAAGKPVAVTKSNAKAYTHYVQLLPKNVAAPSAVGSAVPVGLTPQQVRAAYGMDAINFNGIVGDGTGQTIAIVDAYDHPGFVSSTDPTFTNSDLYQFASQTGLLAQYGTPSFTKLDQTGGTNYPTQNSGWAGEIALDVEWAYAMAPKANIVLVEANSNSFSDLITAAVNTARNLPNVSVVSMSFGADGGFAGENYFDQFFTTPAGHNGVSFVASSGDHGSVTPAGGTTGAAAYPAESANVLAVGGTTLTTSANAYVGETAWSGTGGGVSNFISKPAYQTAVTQSSSFRAAPDVSILGDPGTGVAVYDSYNNTSGGGWNSFLVGGTSLSAPLWAGVMAVANQGRSVIGLGTLNGPTQSQTRVYQLPASALHDVSTGSNNLYTAAAGYDLVSGRGTPVGQSTLTSLAGGTYGGTTYIDRNGNATFDAAVDGVQAGVTVFNDANGNLTLDGNESSATSNANGVWTLDVAAGIPLNVREAVPGGFLRTTSQAIGSGLTQYGTFTLGSFGNFPTTYNLPAGNNTVRVRADGTATNLQVFINTPTTKAPTYTIKRTLVSALTINGNTADDAFVLDLANGAPFSNSSGAITFNGGAQVTGDTFEVVNVPVSTAAFTFTATGTALPGIRTTLNNVEQRTYTGSALNDGVVLSGVTAATTPAFVGNGGTDTITVSNASVYQPTTNLGGDGTAVNVNVSGGSAVTFRAAQRLNALTLAGSTVALAAGGLVLRTSGLSVDSTSTLDLADGGLIYDYVSATPAGTVGGLIASGYANGTWTGVGVRSSAAAAAASGKYGLGYGEASDVLGANGGTFLGQSVDSTTLLVRYTLRGDATLNGTVDFNDFLVLQNNFGKTGRTFAQGDFDYNGNTDFNDFLSLQNNFGTSV